MPVLELLKVILIACPLALGLWLRYQLLLTSTFRNGFYLTLLLFTLTGLGWALLAPSTATELGWTLAMEQRWLNGLILMAIVVCLPYLAAGRIVLGPWTPILCLAWTLLILPNLLQRIPQGVADILCLLMLPGAAFAMGALHALFGIALAGLNLSLALASWLYGLNAPPLWSDALQWLGWSDPRLAWSLLALSTVLAIATSLKWTALPGLRKATAS